MNYTKKNFDYSRKKWGITPITNLKTDFQGLEIIHFFLDAEKLLPKNAKILDIGCGGGNILGYITQRKKTWHTTGVDISKEVLTVAKQQFSEVEFKKADAKRLPINKNTYDCVLYMDSLEHIEEPEKTLKEAWRVLKPGGVLFVSIPLEKQFPSLYWLFYKMGWRGKATHSGHVNFYTDSQFTKFVRDQGFELKRRRFSYHFLFSLFDIGFYILESLLGGKSISFETSVNQMQPGFKQSALDSFKKFVSVVSYYESTFLEKFPGGKGHYTFVKQEKPDFFSHNPPFTFFEKYQTDVGLSKVLRPKDLAIKNHLKRLGFSKVSTILDFGTANGLWLERILRGNNKKGIGVDIAKDLIAEANSRKGKKGQYINTMHNWPIKPKSIDLVVSFDVFEHIDPEQTKIEIKRLYNSLKPGGKLLFYTLNPKHKYTFDWAFEKLGSDYLYRRADHDISIFPDPKDLRNRLETQGFKNVNYHLFDGPANLVWDVGCYAYLAILGKLLTVLHLSFLIHPLITVNDLVVRVVYPVNKLIDQYVFKTGHSNGYFIWGEK